MTKDTFYVMVMTNWSGVEKYFATLRPMKMLQGGFHVANLMGGFVVNGILTKCC